MTDAEKKVLDEEVVVESVDVEVGTMEDVDAIMKKFDRESNTRVWEGTPKKILRYVLAAFMLFMVYMNLWATWSGQIRRCLFVGFVILFTFFIYPVKKGNVKPNSMPWYDILLAVAGCIPYFYYVANFKRIVAMGIAIGQTEVILGIIGTLVLVRKWAERKGVTPAQFALIWMLSRKSWIAPIPGTTNPAHLDELLGAGTVRLSAWEMEEFDREYARIDLMGHRADPFTESQIDK